MDKVITIFFTLNTPSEYILRISFTENFSISPYPKNKKNPMNNAIIIETFIKTHVIKINTNVKRITISNIKIPPF